MFYFAIPGGKKELEWLESFLPSLQDGYFRICREEAAPDRPCGLKTWSTPVACAPEVEYK